MTYDQTQQCGIHLHSADLRFHHMALSIHCHHVGHISIGRHSIVDAQLQLAYLVLTFTSSISYLHAPFAWLPFPLHPTFILPFPAVCTGGNSISPLVHNRLSACNSTPTSTWAWSLLQAGAGWIPQALRPEKLTGAMGREGKPEQTSKGSPLTYVTSSIKRRKTH